MNKIKTAIVLSVLLATSTQARPKHWYSDKQFWIGRIVAAGAAAFDTKTTCDNFKVGGTEAVFPFQGNHNCSVTIGTNIGGWLLGTGLQAASWHCSQNESVFGKCIGWNNDNTKHPKLWSPIVHYDISAMETGFHLYSGIHNLELKK